MIDCPHCEKPFYSKYCPDCGYDPNALFKAIRPRQNPAKPIIAIPCDMPGCQWHAITRDKANTKNLCRYHWEHQE